MRSRHYQHTPRDMFTKAIKVSPVDDSHFHVLRYFERQRKRAKLVEAARNGGGYCPCSRVNLCHDCLSPWRCPVRATGAVQRRGSNERSRCGSLSIPACSPSDAKTVESIRPRLDLESHSGHATPKKNPYQHKKKKSPDPLRPLAKTFHSE